MPSTPAPQPMPVSPPTSGLAIASLVLSIMAWVALPLLGGIAGVVCGHLARAEIRRSRGAVEGDGLAVAGLIVGYVNIALFAVIAIIAVLLFAGVFGLAALN
ncbi:DUF4190 domain-containing protein [Lysobacter humi (ex Lee et al. 2017)]